MQLGVFPGISLAEAREKHGAALVDVQRGIDPGAKAKRKRKPKERLPRPLKTFLTNFGKSNCGIKNQVFRPKKS